MEIQAQKRVILYVYMQCIEFFVEKSQVTNVVKYLEVHVVGILFID